MMGTGVRHTFCRDRVVKHSFFAVHAGNSWTCQGHAWPMIKACYIGWQAHANPHFVPLLPSAGPTFSNFISGVFWRNATSADPIFITQLSHLFHSFPHLRTSGCGGASAWIAWTIKSDSRAWKEFVRFYFPDQFLFLILTLRKAIDFRSTPSVYFFSFHLQVICVSSLHLQPICIAFTWKHSKFEVLAAASWFYGVKWREMVGGEESF